MLTEIIKDGTGRYRISDNKYWIAAPNENVARAYASFWGEVIRSHWAGPGHFRSDVYIVEVK